MLMDLASMQETQREECLNTYKDMFKKKKKINRPESKFDSPLCYRPFLADAKAGMFKRLRLVR